MPALIHLVIQAFGLMVLLSLLLALMGCAPSLVTTPTSSTRLYPAVTLTVVDMQTLIAPTLPASRLALTVAAGASPSQDFLQPVKTRAYPPDPTLNLIPQPPTCYPQGASGWICLGRVDNLSPRAARDVVLLARLLAQNGQEVAVQRVTLEQQRIDGQGFAPYRVQWSGAERSPEELHQAPLAWLVVESAQVERQPGPSLAVSDERAFFKDGRYNLSALVRNTGRRAVRASASATLLNVRNEVVGYRIKERPEALQVEESWQLELEIIPQVGDNIYHVLQVHGR
ncbi:MAG: hypothetical protein NZ750_08175 [Anaerolineae bacterium]|nr:hypothetical protein [Anaerolineae bacterium]MDW8172326.1 hypothetical protein [Anaerolineae bacterium]